MKRGKANSDNSSDPAFGVLSQDGYNKSCTKKPLLTRILTYLEGHPRTGNRILTNFGWVDAKFVDEARKREGGL